MSNDKPTVVEALSSVMEDVQAIRKGDRNTHQNFKFRGIDAVVNAVGPALRKHRVVVVPTGAVHTEERYQTASGTAMRGVTVNVCYRFIGPAGDYIDACVLGEAADAGDKAVPKAFSVAYRTLLLQALCVPTDEPDPDGHSHERGSHESVNGDPLGFSESRADAPQTGSGPGAVEVTWGKHKGKLVRDVPASYWEWWLTSEMAAKPDFQEFRANIELHLGLTSAAVAPDPDADIPF